MAETESERIQGLVKIDFRCYNLTINKKKRTDLDGTNRSLKVKIKILKKYSVIYRLRCFNDRK